MTLDLFRTIPILFYIKAFQETSYSYCRVAVLVLCTDPWAPVVEAAYVN